jgi:hypothetical protein
LTDAYALYFALNAVPEHSDGQPLIVEIETDLDPMAHGLLCPDEDFIAQVLWHGRGKGERLHPAKLNRAKSLRELSQMIEPKAYQTSWEESVAHLGNCCRYGGVPRACITRHAVIDAAACTLLCYQALEPTISLLNYRFLAPWYRSLIAHIFDGAPLTQGEADIVAPEHSAALLQALHDERHNGVRVVAYPRQDGAGMPSRAQV